MTRLRVVASGGVGALAERVLADLDGLVGEMGAAYQAEIPEYAAMSDATMVRDVLPDGSTGWHTVDVTATPA